MKRRMNIGFGGICLFAVVFGVIAILLGGSDAEGAGAPPRLDMPATQVTTIPAPEYTIRFEVQDQVTVQTVTAGEPVTPPLGSPEGLAIVAWSDLSGNYVDMDTVTATGDAVYTAVLFPDFYDHAPYMFVDEDGFVHPEDVFTGEAFTAAMRALAPDRVLKEMHLPEGDAAVTKQTLAAQLDGLFPPETLRDALNRIKDGDLTRVEFARFMNTLLGRGGGETLVIDAGQALPRDLSLDNADADDILEAVITHKEAEAGLGMLDAVLESHWQPGFTLIHGNLYYADENGALLRDGQLGTLSFGADGRYTSGDAELDRYVTDLLWSFVQEDPAADRYDILYRAFRYCRNEFYYVNRGYIDYGATGWETEWAKAMFESGAGNCYSYAAAFCSLARGLGYDAHCISGLVLELSRPHGWCEFEIDGENFFFDPQLARADMMGERDNWGEDMFAIPMWDTWSWRYIWSEG